MNDSFHNVTSTALREHQAWLGYLQPEGLVVSAAALIESQAILNRAGAAELQQRFLDHLASRPIGAEEQPAPAIRSLNGLLTGFFGWPADLLIGGGFAAPLPEALRVPLRDFGETLEPTFALLDPKPANPDRPWQLLVQELPEPGADLDTAVESAHPGWSATPTQRFERLLRETGVAIGLLSNTTCLRLIYAPHGENSGHITFPVDFLAGVPGRSALAALELLLSSERLITAASRHRLPAILRLSREMQAAVSTRLADQILGALYELMRGFHVADNACRGTLLSETLAADPQALYNGLLTVLMRLVFLLYAEDRGLMPGSSLYTGHYSVHGLARRLQADAERFPDTMDHRYGAWPQLLALFRMVFKGCTHPDLKLPQRLGHLFDFTRFPFLEGRDSGMGRRGDGETGRPDSRATAPSPSLPLIPDGFLHRVMRALLVLDGERVSYKTLDVEQIGSVYSAMMGFHVARATGATIALRPGKAHGAPVPADLDALLSTPAGKRATWVAEKTDYKPPARLAADLRDAASIDDLLVALDRRIARNATPHPLAPGTPILNPTDERRSSGSHYTPRSLTQPIVEKALAPIFARMGVSPTSPVSPSPHLPIPPSYPTPDEILSLKICDPAMGSGAFLVEACRQIATVLIASWKAHDITPVIPPDEDIVLYARRIVAQRCLYGVDRNPMATDLAKLSLWLATLARNQPFTFLDHALRTGDALVGLSRAQIEAFHWDANQPPTFIQHELARRIEAAIRERRLILASGDQMPPGTKAQKLGVADDTLQLARDIGDACLAAFFSADKPKARLAHRGQILEAVEAFLTRHDYTDAGGKAFYAAASALHAIPVTPFHWEIEFPEVFQSPSLPFSPSPRPLLSPSSHPPVSPSSSSGGFDAIIGNPPFAGKNTLINGNPPGYLDWLQVLHAESHGNADLVAHFYRRAFDLLRAGGTFGLIATNTIGQGDTRHTGLRWICAHGGTIFAARKRLKWPGEAAVVVSVVHVGREVNGEQLTVNGGSLFTGPYDLDGCPVDRITAYLFHAGGHETPAVLEANADKSFQGSIVLGMGFTFDDTDKKGVANPISLMHELIAKDARNAERIFPYIGGEEINDSPVQAHHRFVINFADFPIRRDDLGATWAAASEKQRKEWLRSGIVPLDFPDLVAADWPDLLKIVEEKVKPERMKQKDKYGQDHWWQFLRTRPELAAAMRDKESVLAISRVTQHFCIARLVADMVFSERLAIFPFEDFGSFACIQSTLHENWSRFFGSTLEDRFMYAPADCFETFPFPTAWDTDDLIESTGQTYYDYRAELMKDLWIGLTDTYNLFHAPDHEAMERLRKLYEKRMASGERYAAETFSEGFLKVAEAPAAYADRSPALYRSPEEALAAIIRLRELHAAMDRAVLDAYGWIDIPTDCEFILDYDDAEEDGETGGAGDGETGKASRRKKPWRYRWPDSVRDEVLARLLALNAERAEEERLTEEAVIPLRKLGARRQSAINTHLELSL